MAPIKNKDVKESDSGLRLSPLYFLRNGNRFQNSNGSSGSGELWLTKPNKWKKTITSELNTVQRMWGKVGFSQRYIG